MTWLPFQPATIYLTIVFIVVPVGIPRWGPAVARGLLYRANSLAEGGPQPLLERLESAKDVLRNGRTMLSQRCSCLLRGLL